jgi:hypothetical protein
MLRVNIEQHDSDFERFAEKDGVTQIEVLT